MAASLRGQNLFAPVLLRFEMAHVCIKKIRERPNERDLILSQYASSLQMPIQLVPVDYVGVVGMAERSKLSAYDASYLWLALRLRIELVTGDDELTRAYAAAAL